MNDLPPQFFSDAALAKRVAIIEFDQQITPQEKDTDFAEKIMADERPGILNWIIAGLDQLLKTRRLDPPPCCIEAIERIRKENDSIAGWAEERRRCPGHCHHIILQAAYDDFDWYCEQNGHKVPSKKTFASRLRDAGYEVSRPNGHEPFRLYFSTPPVPEK